MIQYWKASLPPLSLCFVMVRVLSQTMQERILKSYLFINFLLYSFSYDPGAIKDQDHICCYLEIPMGDVEGCLKLFSRCLIHNSTPFKDLAQLLGFKIVETNS